MLQRFRHHAAPSGRRLSFSLAATSLLTLAAFGLAAAPTTAGQEPVAEAPALPPGAAEVQPEAPEIEGVPEDPQEREDFLLREALRYLKLTRAQLLALAPLAQEIAPARRSFEAEEAKLLGALEAQADPEAPEAVQLRQELEGRRATWKAQVLAYIAPRFTRQLTREQIALAWRLHGHNPPKYAPAHPALLLPDAGFAQPARRFRSEGVFLGERQLQLDSGPLVDTRETLREEQRAATESLRRTQTVLGRARVNLEVLIPSGPGGSSRSVAPFPQRVVETNDLAELVPAVEPFAARLFLSGRLVVCQACNDG